MAALGVRPTFVSDLPALARCNSRHGLEGDTGGGCRQACDEAAAGASGGDRLGQAIESGASRYGTIGSLNPRLDRWRSRWWSSRTYGARRRTRACSSFG